MKEDNNPIDKALVLRHVQGNTNPEEAKQVSQWIAESYENRTYYEQAKQLWELSGQLANFDLIDVDANWNKFVQTTAIGSKKQGYHISWFVKVAAAIAVLFVVGTYYYSMQQGWLGKSGSLVTLKSSTEQVSKHVLPDSSLVWLNKGAVLSYIDGFAGDTRAVTLEGEAYFEVKKQPLKPFLVSLNGTETEVLGTSFNLKGNEESVQLHLITGKVAFRAPKGQAEVSPGEQVSVAKDGTLVKQNNNDPNFLAWKTGILTFNEVPVKVALESIARHYAVEIALGDEVNTECTVTTRFEALPLASIFEIFEVLFKAQFTEISQGKYEITQVNCQ